jgi:phosphoglycolate phosphatase
LKKLVIFDFDGTLVDSVPGIVKTMTAVGRKMNFPASIIDEWKDLIGLPIVRQMEIILPERDAAFHMEVVDCYRTIYDAEAVELCPLFPGVLEALKTIRDRGIMLSIATSKRHILVEAVLKSYNIDSWFELILGADDVKNHKPHPETVLTTLKKLSINPAEAVVVGDSTFDLQMAEEAGVDGIGVTTGTQTRDVLVVCKTISIVSHLSEIVPIILNAEVSTIGS